MLKDRMTDIGDYLRLSWIYLGSKIVFAGSNFVTDMVKSLFVDVNYLQMLMQRNISRKGVQFFKSQRYVGVSGLDPEIDSFQHS